jgi:CRP-like cAMP-binding protein
MKDIPKGWVRVSQYDNRDDKNSGGPSGDYARILAAIKLEPPAVRAYRDGKFWIASIEDIEELLGEPGQSVDAVAPSTAAALMSSRQAESVIVALCEISNGVALMLDVLERLTTAVEGMATQPRTEEQVREAITTACRNADGFENFRS